MQALVTIGSILFTTYQLTPPLPILEKGKDFALSAVPITAMEDGPLVVQVTLKYDGEQPVTVKRFNRNVVIVHHPKEWESGNVIQIRGGNGRQPAPKTMCKGEEWKEIVYVHYDYVNICSGKAELTISWPLYEVENEEQMMLAPTTRLSFMIDPANQQKLADLRGAILSSVREVKSAHDFSYILDSIRGVSHESLVDIPFAILVHPGAKWHHHTRAINCIYTMLQSVDKANQRIGERLRDHGSIADYPFFWYWQSFDNYRPKSDVLSMIASSQDLWVKLLAYSYSPELFSRNDIDELLNKAKLLKEPLPKEVTMHLLLELSSPAFARRERASRTLFQAGERLIPTLIQLELDNLSAEATRRLEKIQMEIRSQVPSEVEQRVFAFLARNEECHNVQLIRTLAEGPEWMWLTKQAKHHLQENKSKPAPAWPWPTRTGTGFRGENGTRENRAERGRDSFSVANKRVPSPFRPPDIVLSITHMTYECDE